MMIFKNNLFTLTIMVVWVLTSCSRSDSFTADPDNAQQVAAGAQVYQEHCASCHGVNLEGQADWRKRGANGRLPAPPHDDSGHTWHHPDNVLIEIIKNGLVPPYAPQGYESDMPAWTDKLSDEQMWSVLAYIKSKWSAESRRVQREIDEKAQQNK